MAYSRKSQRKKNTRKVSRRKTIKKISRRKSGKVSRSKALKTWAGKKKLNSYFGTWRNPYNNRLTRFKQGDGKIIAEVQRKKFKNHKFDNEE